MVGAREMKVKLSWEQIQKDCVLLANEIKKSGKTYSEIVAVARGGLIPATIISHLLNISRIRSIQVIGYNDSNEDLKDRVLIGDFVIISNNALFIDDLSDSGETIRKIKRQCPTADFAVLYTKPNGEKEPTYSVASFEQDEWLVFPYEI